MARSGSPPEPKDTSTASTLLGKGELVYDGEDPHLRSLRVERGGGLLIGTAGQGLLLRRSPDGGVRTLYDSTLSEVVAIAEAPGGTVFAAVLASEASLVDLAASRPAAEASQAGEAGAEPQATVSVAGEGEGETPGAGGTGASGAIGAIGSRPQAPAGRAASWWRSPLPASSSRSGRRRKRPSSPSPG